MAFGGKRRAPKVLARGTGEITEPRQRMKRTWRTDAVRIEKVAFLGTGSAIPVPGKRNMSSLTVILSSGAVIMVDCGEGTQHHIRISSVVKAIKIEAILLTHLHGDHCYGLFGLLHTVATEGRKDPVLLVGPEGLRDMVETVFKYSGGWFPADSFEIKFLEIPNSGTLDGEDLVGSDGYGPSKTGFNAERCARAKPVHLGDVCGLELRAVPMVHSLPDWGYVLKEPDRPGSLDLAKCKDLGLPTKSPLLGQLKRGEEITLENGSVVSPTQVIGPTIVGRTVAVLQDTCNSVSAISACKGAACVIHEATFEAAMEEDALKKGHSTSVMAARFAAACGAQRLVLTHFSARYCNSVAPAGTAGTADAAKAPAENNHWGGDLAEMLGDEARKELGDAVPVVVAKDFMVLRGDRDFEPEPELALRGAPWQRVLLEPRVPRWNGIGACPCCG